MYLYFVWMTSNRHKEGWGYSKQKVISMGECFGPYRYVFKYICTVMLQVYVLETFDHIP